MLFSARWQTDSFLLLLLLIAAFCCKMLVGSCGASAGWKQDVQTEGFVFVSFHDDSSTSQTPFAAAAAMISPPTAALHSGRRSAQEILVLHGQDVPPAAPTTTSCTHSPLVSHLLDGKENSINMPPPSLLTSYIYI